jgi:hypothetical protein
MSNYNSLLDRALLPEATTEKCLVQQYRTPLEQQQLLREHTVDVDRTRIPVEWIIDIADEANGWFYGTAYHYDDVAMTLHVMVPDKLNPTFDGTVQLDHRTVHLIECIDGKTDALFNCIVRESTTRCKWEVDWFEEGTGNQQLIEGANDETGGEVLGTWNATVAKYYYRITNQLLVEDVLQEGQTQVGYVLLTADINVKFKHCTKEKGAEDFYRLVYENTVQSTPEALDAATDYMTRGPEPEPLMDEHVVPEAAPVDDRYSPKKSPTREDRQDSIQLGDDDVSRSASKTPSRGDRDRDRDDDRGGRDRDRDRDGGGGGDRVPPVRKLAEMSKHLKECLNEILEEREKKNKFRTFVGKNFQKFILDGDLDAGTFGLCCSSSCLLSADCDFGLLVWNSVYRPCPDGCF